MFQEKPPELSPVKEDKVEAKEEILQPPIEKSIFSIEKQTISPALQETDSALLESIVSQTPVSLEVKLEETAKELSNVKTGTKIADSILQKLNSFKNDIENKNNKSENNETEEKKEVKLEFKFELRMNKPVTEVKDNSKEEDIPKEEDSVKTDESIEIKKDSSPNATEESKKPSLLSRFESADLKKRRKALSKPFIEESDSDSSDSEQLVIARSDDDSQTDSIDNKLQPDLKESDSSNMFAQLHTTDDSQSQEERNFNFDGKDDKVSDCFW